jgi:hypothetical protein
MQMASVLATVELLSHFRPFDKRVRYTISITIMLFLHAFKIKPTSFAFHMKINVHDMVNADKLQD